MVGNRNTGILNSFENIRKNEANVHQEQNCLIFRDVLKSHLSTDVWTNVTQGSRSHRIFIPIMPISSPNPMFDLLLESSQWDDILTRGQT